MGLRLPGRTSNDANWQLTELIQGGGATCATLSRVYMRKRGIYPPLLPFIFARVCVHTCIYIFVGGCSRMQEEKEEVRTLLLPFLGQSLNCAECFAVVKVYARYRGLLWPCFDHWLSMAWQFRWVLFRETLSVDVVKWFFIPSLSRERDIYVYFRHVFSIDGKFSIIIATRVQFLNWNWHAEDKNCTKRVRFLPLPEINSKQFGSETTGARGGISNNCD